MDLWTKHFHDMATGKLETMHKSVHNSPQPTEPRHTDQVGGSQVPPKTENVISTVDRIKNQKSAKTNPQNKKATGKKRSVGANKSQQKAVKKARQNEFEVRRRLQRQAGIFF